jgi:hypothetical protein
MGQEIVLPDWAKMKPAPAFAVLNPADDSLSEGIGQSYPVIGYKGKVWSFRHRGERKNFIRPDDGTPASYLDVIILGQAKQKSKSFYKKFDPNQSDGDRPICSSIDGIMPDPDVTAKQADACALCPRNVWKTDPQTGRKGRECTDYKRLAVLVVPTQTKPLFGEPVLEPAFLRVPPASLNSLAIMGDTMAGQGFHYASYITRITFDPNEAHPKMMFRPLQGLTDQEAPVILQMRGDMQVDRIINGGFAEGARHVPPQEGTTLLPPGSNNTGLMLEAQANQPSIGAATPNNTGLSAAQSPSTIQQTASIPAASAQPATPATPPPVQENPTGVSTGLTGLVATGAADIGLGVAQPAVQQQAATPAVQQTAGDTGAAEASDDDLDAKIAGMLGKPKA